MSHANHSPVPSTSCVGLRLTILKKAYVDIILNVAKEASAMIVASEAKVVRLEKELNESKGQALQMLVRLKKLMDCKVLEAEMTSYDQQRMIKELNGQLRDATEKIQKAEESSLSQSKKIEEIEAQLNEAEDIVKDLREELKEVHTESERFRTNKPYRNKPFDTATKEETMIHVEILNVDEPNLLPPIPEENTLKSLNEMILYKRNESSIGNSNEIEPVIPSIILKSKEPEFCGNRRTQRIRAFEEKIMAGELSFTDKTHNVEIKAPKIGVTGKRRRKFHKCKKKKISSTNDIFNRTREIEDTEDNTQLTHERIGSSNEEFIETNCARNTLDGDMALMDVKKDNVAETIETRSGAANGIDYQPVSGRIFKYTFQRKRKRESMSKFLKKNTVERLNCSPEEEKCSSTVESSSDSRRLALVAHQLISLSDKKW